MEKILHGKMMSFKQELRLLTLKQVLYLLLELEEIALEKEVSTLQPKLEDNQDLPQNHYLITVQPWNITIIQHINSLTMNHGHIQMDLALATGMADMVD